MKIVDEIFFTYLSYLVNKKLILTLASVSGCVFAAIPVSAYIALLFAGLAFLSFSSAVLSVLFKLVWIGLFFIYAVPQVTQFVAFQFLVGFAEAMKVLDPAKPVDEAAEKELDEKFAKDLKTIAEQQKEVK